MLSSKEAAPGFVKRSIDFKTQKKIVSVHPIAGGKQFKEDEEFIITRRKKRQADIKKLKKRIKKKRWVNQGKQPVVTGGAGALGFIPSQDHPKPYKNKSQSLIGVS